MPASWSSSRFIPRSPFSSYSYTIHYYHSYIIIRLFGVGVFFLAVVCRWVVPLLPLSNLLLQSLLYVSQEGIYRFAVAFVTFVFISSLGDSSCICVIIQFGSISCFLKRLFCVFVSGVWLSSSMQSGIRFEAAFNPGHMLILHDSGLYVDYPDALPHSRSWQINSIALRVAYSLTCNQTLA